MAFVFIAACNSVNETVDLRIFSQATSVSAGYRHTCAVLSGGTVKCWGGGSYGQLGNGSTTSSQTTPVSVSSISTATSVSAGDSHTCAVLSGGTVKCWGGGSYGQLGNGSTTSSQTTPVSVSSISTATSVSAGDSHTCAVLSGGTVKCWGYGGYGQLGNGSITSSQTTPVSVNSISTATSVSAGDYHTCAALSGGTVKCWGYGGYGQLGNGSTSSQTTPVSVSSISTATSVSAGDYHTCAVLSGGTVKCWGGGYSGQLGNGSTSSQTTPVSVRRHQHCHFRFCRRLSHLRGTLRRHGQMLGGRLLRSVGQRLNKQSIYSGFSQQHQHCHLRFWRI